MEDLKKKLTVIVEDMNYYLYDMTYLKEGNNFVLRLLIDGDKGINIDDCIVVSKAVSEELDVIDPFVDPYNFEVTSAGAERELRNNEEIQRAVGKNVHIETFEQKMDGKLEKFSEGILFLKHKNKRISQINYIDVNFIRLAIVF